MSYIDIITNEVSLRLRNPIIKNLDELKNVKGVSTKIIEAIKKES